VKCKPYRSFLIILDLSLSSGLLLHAHLDLVEVLKNNSEMEWCLFRTHTAYLGEVP
jgi:hypothetical protein